MAIVDSKIGKGVIYYNEKQMNLYGCEIGDNTKLGVFIEIGRNVRVGERCKIQSHTFIPEGVEIGNDVFIGPQVVFCNVKRPMTGERYATTIVCDNAVIGAGAVILPGLIIGKGAVVGAGSVVTKNVPKWATVYGNPARVA